MSRRRNFARSLTAAFLLAVAAALLLLPSAPGHAQTTTYTYVSNIDQGSDDDTSGSTVRAQRFTTGSQSGGYTVTHVDIGYDDADGDKFSAAIYTVDSDGYPDSEVFALTAPTGAWAAGTTLSFTAPANSTLSASTTYTVRMAPTGVAVRLDTTTSSDEDSGAFSGWSIQDVFDASITSGWVHSTSGEIIRIAIKGTTAKPVSFSDLQAGHTSPTGMWSPDGSTLWLGQWFSTQVYAYNLADETANSSENWTLHNPANASDKNRKPTGIWSNGTHIYVTDADHGRVFQYNAGDKSLTSTTLSLHADNGNRQGLWSDGTTAWVSDAADDKLYAYQLSDFSRDSDKDIRLGSGNTAPRGIWSDGTTIWVLDNGDEKLYTYNLADGSRAAADLDIDLDADGENYNSIWSDGTTMYVVENTSGSATRDPQIHKLPLPAQDETVVWEATLTSADNWALGSNYTYDGYGSSAFSLITTTQGSLSPDSFTVGATTHTVHVLGVREGTDNRLYLFTDTAASKSDLAGYAMEFTVDGSTTTLKVEDATPESGLGFYWAESLHSFGADDWQAKTITVKLRTANNPATGAPLISGTPQVGRVLTAVTPDIMDADGLTSSTLTYQWIRVDGATETDISGATSYVYTLVAADEGKTIKVKVSFTDDANNAETLTSAATAAVAAGGTDDCADDTTTTCSVSVGSSVTGEIENASETDYFSLSVTLGVTYRIDVEGAPTSMGTLGDPWVGLEVDSQFLTFDDDGGDGPNSRLTWTAQETATYYVVVREALYNNTGTYTLTVSVATDDCAGDTTTTCSVSVGSSVTGEIEDDNDSDYFSLSVTSGVTYQIDAEGSDTGKGTLGNPYLYLRDASDTKLAEDENGGTGRNARIVWTASSTGTFYVDVQESSYVNTGTYTLTVSANNPATGAPTISGTAQVRETLTAATSGIMDADGLTGVRYSYQWIRVDGGTESNISGATSNTYTLVAADEGKTIKVKVSFTDNASNAETLTSAATAAVAAAPDCAGTTATTCSVSVGSSTTGEIDSNADADYFSLSVTSGTTYRIDAEGSATSKGTLQDPYVGIFISGNTSPVASDDNGGDGSNARLVWTATTTGTVYVVVREASSANTGTYTLTVSLHGIADCGRSHWDRNKPLALQLRDGSCEYQARSRNIWADGSITAQELAEIQPLVTRLREIVDDLPCDSGPHRYNDGAGEQSLYKGPAPECLVRTTKSAGGGLPWESPTQPTALPPNTPATGAPTISGTAQVGETLTADTSGIADEDGLENAVFTYQWLADGADISGATGLTYTLVSDGEGKAISVTVSFTDDAGHSEELTSAPTSAVALPPWSEDLTRGRQPSELFAEANDEGIRLCWFAPNKAADEVTGYRVLRRLPETGGSFAPHGEDLGSTAAGVVGQCWTDSEVEEGVLYAYRIKAIRNYRELSRWSRFASARATVTGVTEAPVNTPATGLPTISGTAQVGETLTADITGIADEDGLTNATFGYQWQAGDADIAGATGATYTLTDSDVGKAVSVSVSFTDDAGNEETLTSAATDAVEPGTEEAQAANTPATGAPAVTGTAQVSETLTADTSGIADTDGLTNVAYSYQWLADGAEISGATGATYTLTDSDEGKAISVTVSFTDDAGNDETLTGAATVAVGPKPNTPATGAPTITGIARVGEKLTADLSGIADVDGVTNASVSYQWQADGADIPGATKNCYTPDDADEGKTISVRVTFTDDRGHEETLTSAATDALEARPNRPATGALTITGTAQVGELLTAEVSSIADADGLDKAAFAYQWQADGADISGATDATYTLTDSDEGKAISVTASFTDNAGHEESFTSTATAAVEAAAEEDEEPTDRPHGLTAGASNGAVVLTWTAPVVDYEVNSYHILRHRPEQGEAEPLVYVDQTPNDDTAYTDTDVEAGVLYVYRVKAIVNWMGDLGDASDPAQIRAPATAQEQTANNPATGAPTITGKAQVGQTLTADVSGIADEDGLTNVTFSYQWQADGADISSATSDTYTLADADEGKAVSVTVSFTDDGGNGETLTSAATDAVEPGTEEAQAANSPATGAPTISGTAQVGETLTSDTSGIADADGLDNAVFSYQWQADGTDISGATGASYTLVDDDEGKAISVTVSFTDDYGNEETLTSAATGAVDGAPSTPLTASLENVATSHDGETTFTFELRFSEEFSLSYRTLRDHAFTVTGGTVKKAQRLEQGSNIGWRITVRPDGDGQVVIILPVTEDCDAQGAICTEDGRKLSSELELTVSGP